MTAWSWPAGATTWTWRVRRRTSITASSKRRSSKHNLKLFAISNHLAGQLVCDLNNDARSDLFAPQETHGDPEKKRAWAVEAMKDTARAAKNLGLKVANGFTGSSIWHLLYSFPPVSDAMIDEGFAHFAKMWNPILDVFDEQGVRFALEVHPTEIAFDIHTAKRALEAWATGRRSGSTSTRATCTGSSSIRRRSCGLSTTGSTTST
jgi:hypothetical protein